PFISGINAGAHLVLVSHNVVTCMDAELPASLSPKVHTILRDTMGFTGLILTDDLAMKAIDAYGEKAAPVGAALAGNDLMITTDYAAAYHQLLQAIEAGELPVELVNRAAMRILAWKLKIGLL
ncbi:glycoside hydrolase family 3 N-terminal domain-containing protein, partial [Akkermansia muciniphila]|uniref:glycoside hydrolase family 3 N-terminal domain-containing protein n=1 Tax=Akkermansia muciniphila TaxID=239935 RepID=UPI00125143D6